ncbi:MAG: Lar family restriction alleviation protein [Muribaculaceae bacterium]|nr:Lar family restriction alleviation protein [Muribaculaceae bacterium]MCM1399881.1 Lar family restriction alleviation protein [Clostridium sp.]MCM1460633.1 Lar family restriction alleviation protein [Bacteroides sp.]
MEELKSCPFCGHKPKLTHYTEKANARAGISELSIYWEVRCNYCSCVRDGGYSEYFINDDGQLVLNTKEYEKEPVDARKKAIDEWNRRCQNDGE